MSDIKSRPIWAKLRPVSHATSHLVCAEGAGASAVAEAFAGSGDILRATTILHVRDRHDADADVDILDRLGASSCHHYPSRQTAFLALRAHLARATMGARLYLAGSDAFLSEGATIAADFYMGDDGLQTELRGAQVRRVQCVHCKGMMDGVAQSPVTCEHCGVNLMVRDYYSRRLGAFMGVCVDAEAPGNVPAPVEF